MTRTSHTATAPGDLRDVFYAPPEQVSAGKIHLHGEEHRHLRGSLRKRPGDRVAVVDGRGVCYHAVLVRVDRDASEARIEARLSMWGEPKLRLTVATAVPKGSRMEFAIEKGTELGVSRFVPLRTRRSIAGAPPGKIERWRRLALAAMKQSRRSVLPEVTHETSLPEVLTSVETVPLKFIADSAGQDIRQASIRGPKSDATEAVVLIGPEGGFTDDELSQAVEAGFVPLALGPRRLRVETAAVVAATLILHAVGELEPLLGEASW